MLREGLLFSGEKAPPAGRIFRKDKHEQFSH